MTVHESLRSSRKIIQQKLESWLIDILYLRLLHQLYGAIIIQFQMHHGQSRGDTLSCIVCMPVTIF